MIDTHYCYPPDFTVLRNHLGLRDRAALDKAERALVAQRLKEPAPTGRFDLDHLQALHHYLFRDVYPWAGEIRTVSLTKGTTQFQPPRFIVTGVAEVYKRLTQEGLLRGRSPEAFAEGAAQAIGDLNYVHPFREGNGRTQLLYLRQLAEQADQRFDLNRLDRDAWLHASIAAIDQDFAPMAEAIRGALGAPTPERETRAARMQARYQAHRARSRTPRPERDLGHDPEQHG